MLRHRAAGHPWLRRVVSRSAGARAVVLVAAAAAGLAAVPAATASAAWREAGALRSGRTDHTATLLGNGRVLVAGGSTGGFLSPITPSAELYDPAFRPPLPISDLSARAVSPHAIALRFTPPGPWRSTASMLEPRSEHTATRLRDGRVLVAGGRGSSSTPTAAAEIYDPAAGTWAPAGRLATARAAHTATLLEDGRVLVAGGVAGNGSPTPSAEVYDPATGAGLAARPMGVARSNHTATLLRDGTVLVAGGNAGSPPRTRAVERYDPTGDQWIPAPCEASAPDPDATSACLHLPRADHSATLLADGRVLVAGGFDDSNLPRRSTEVYDPDAPVAERWTVTASMAFARADHTATLLPDGRALVAGGSGDAPGSAELYGPGDAWSSTDALGTARQGHAATLMASPGCEPRCGQVLVTGGKAPSGAFLRPAELFDTGSAPAHEVDSFGGQWVVKQSRRPITGEASFNRARSLCRVACDVPGFSGEQLTLTVTDLRHRTRYYYAVRHRDKAGNLGPISNLASARTREDKIRPARVSRVSARAISRTRVRLRFAAPGNDAKRPPPARRYIIKQSNRPITNGRRFRAARSLCRRCRFSPPRVGARITITVTGLRPGATYHFAVRARDDAGNLGRISRSVRARLRR